MWKISEDSKCPKINSIKDLWKYLDSIGGRKDCGYEKLIHCLQHSLTGRNFIISSYMKVSYWCNCLLESEDCKCNAKIQKIIKDHFDDFVDMTNFDEPQPIMEMKQLLTNYDISLPNQQTGVVTC